MTKATAWLCLLVPAAVAAGTPQWRAHEITGTGFSLDPLINELGQVYGQAGRVNKIWTLAGGAVTMPEYSANTSSEPYARHLNESGEMMLSELNFQTFDSWPIVWTEASGYRPYPPSAGISSVNASRINNHGESIVVFNRSLGSNTIWNSRDQSLRTVSGYSLLFLEDEHLVAYRNSDNKIGVLRGDAFFPLQLPPSPEQFFIGNTNRSGYTFGGRSAGGQVHVMVFDPVGRLIADRIEWESYAGISDANVLYGFKIDSVGFQPKIWSEEWGFINPLHHTNDLGIQSTRVKVSSMNSRHEMVIVDADNGREFFLEPVPEPATFASLGLGALAVLRRRRVRPT